MIIIIIIIIIILYSKLVSIYSSIPSSVFLSHSYAVCQNSLLYLNYLYAFLGSSSLMSFSNVLPTCILLWTLPLFKHILAYFSKSNFILIIIIIIIIIMEPEFCHLTLLAKNEKNHVLTAEELKTGWLFPFQTRHHCPRLSHFSPPVIRTLTGVKEGTTFGPQLFGTPGGPNYRRTIAFYRNKI